MNDQVQPTATYGLTVQQERSVELIAAGRRTVRGEVTV